MKNLSLTLKASYWISVSMFFCAMIVLSGSAKAQGTGINVNGPQPVTLIGNPLFEINGTPVSNTDYNNNNWSVSGNFTLNFGFYSNNPFSIKYSDGNVYDVVGISGVYLSYSTSTTTQSPDPDGSNTLVPDPLGGNWINWGTVTNNTSDISYSGYETNGFNTSSSQNPNWLAYVPSGSITGKDWSSLTLPQYGNFGFSNGFGKGTQLSLDILRSDGNTGRITIMNYMVPEAPGALLLLGGSAPLLGMLALFRKKVFSA